MSASMLAPNLSWCVCDAVGARSALGRFPKRRKATGVHDLDWAVTLFKAGWPVSVINPRSFHPFAKLKLAGSKTDRTDASLLAEYGECMKPAL
jgi:transposase